MSHPIDYSRYQTLSISRRGASQSVLDIQMKAQGPGGNGKLPTAGHEGHAELAEIWLDVGRDDSVRCAVLRGQGLGFSGGGDLSLVQDMTRDFEVRTRVWKEARDLVYNLINCDKPIVDPSILEKKWKTIKASNELPRHSKKIFNARRPIPL